MPGILPVGTRMSPKLKQLWAKWKEERTYRDNSAAARKTYAEICRLATPEQLVKILEECTPGTRGSRTATRGAAANPTRSGIIR